MKIPRAFWLGLIAAGVAALLGALLAVPALASSSKQATPPSSPGLTAMHAACTSGNMDAMKAAMDSLTDEDWQAMQEHMKNGHNGSMGSGMMGSGMMDMSGGHMGSGGMMGAGGMMSSMLGGAMMSKSSGRGMMGMGGMTDR